MKILKNGLSKAKIMIVYHCHSCGFIGIDQEKDYLDGGTICPTKYCHSRTHCELVNYCLDENLIIIVSEFHLREFPSHMHSTDGIIHHKIDENIKHLKMLNEDLDALRYLKDFMA